MKIKDLFEVKGIPPGINIKSRMTNNLDGSGRFDLSATPDNRNGYNVEVHPNDGHLASSYKKYPMRDKSKVGYYNPELADLIHYDEDEPIIHSTHAKAKSHLQTEITPLKEQNVIYRGISFEEYNNFLKTRTIVSNGSANLDNQLGLTYWATDPSTAISYANSFAPAAFKPTFTKPCYVMAAYCPKETRHVAGVGENEVGVERPIQSSEIIAIWKGQVYSFDIGTMSLRPNGYDETELIDGGSSAPSSSVVWERIK